MCTVQLLSTGCLQTKASVALANKQHYGEGSWFSVLYCTHLVGNYCQNEEEPLLTIFLLLLLGAGYLANWRATDASNLCQETNHLSGSNGAVV